jgi:hypothetical protein
MIVWLPPLPTDLVRPARTFDLCSNRKMELACLIKKILRSSRRGGDDPWLYLQGFISEDLSFMHSAQQKVRPHRYGPSKENIKMNSLLMYFSN